MSIIRIFDELSEHITLRIRSYGVGAHGRDWIESKRHGDYDLWLVTAGSVHLRSGGEELVASAGDAVFFYPNFPYTAWAGENGGSFIYIHFDFGVGERFEFLEQFPFSGVVSGELIRDEGRLLRESYEGAAAGAGLARMKLKGAFLILLAKIIESYGDGTYEGTFRPSLGYRGQVADVAALQPVFDYIHANLHRPLRIRELASVASMSEKYFISFFKRAVGTTPGKYTFELRMDKAKDYLLRRDISVKEAAALLGYPDAACFSKAFKRRFRQAPSQV